MHVLCAGRMLYMLKYEATGVLRSKHVTSWKYLTVQLSRLSEDDAGDPDLYGMFYGGSSVRSSSSDFSFLSQHL